MDPAMALQYTKHGPLCIGYIFAFYATKMGSRATGDTKVHPHWVKDPPWSFNGPCHGPTIHQTWPFIYWLYFCILCNKKGIKGLWGHKGWPSLGLGPALVLQWTLPWPYNTPHMALYKLAIFLHSMQQKWDQGTMGTQRSTLIGYRTCLGPSMDPNMTLQYTWTGPSRWRIGEGGGHKKSDTCWHGGGVGVHKNLLRGSERWVGGGVQNGQKKFWRHIWTVS